MSEIGDRLESVSDDASNNFPRLREEIATRLGVHVDRVTEFVLLKVVEDPLYAMHLDACRGDAGMLEFLFKEVEQSERSLDSVRSIKQLANGLAVSLTRWARSGFSCVSTEEYQRRLAICRDCSHLTYPPRSIPLYKLVLSTMNERSICGLCGCDVRKKAWMLTEQCPDVEISKEGRWKR